LDGSPWAHQAPVKAADCWLGGNWATAAFTPSVRIIATHNKSPEVDLKKVMVSSTIPTEREIGFQKP
jgi:hypothetical protein